MKTWLSARWQVFLRSFDPDEAAAASSPQGSVIAAGALIVVFLTIGEVPSLRAMSGAGETLACVLLASLGGACTYVAYRTRARGTLGSLGTLLDNGLYSASLALASVSTQAGFAIGFAVIQALFVMAFPASFYGFSLLMTLTLCVPTLALLALYRPSVAVTLVLLASCVIAVNMMFNTQKRRELLAGAKRLQQALGATDQVLDVAMQRALTTTLLNLGNFLHELRNVQTAVRMNLEFLDRDQLSDEQKATVNDALDAARSEQALLDETLEDLRRQAEPHDGSSLVVGEVLERTLRGRVAGLQIDYKNSAPRFEVRGEPTHLSTVLRNLLRNARQAGATRASVELELDPNAGSVAITVADDGPGIPPSRIAELFQPFVTEGKPTGTGLGLYLCRRYVELMHGDLKLESPPGQGARFSIRLPGRVAMKPRDAAGEAPNAN
jgi:signal transduction histidine kinase